MGHHLRIIGKLKAGISAQRAGNDLNVILHGLAQTYVNGYNNSGGPPDFILVHPLQHDLTRACGPRCLRFWAQ